MMFLVVDPQSRSYIFTEEDPRTEGFTGSVEPDVRLEDTLTLNERSEHATTAVPCLGRSPADDKLYRVFESSKQCRQEGFDLVASMYGKYRSWNEYQSDTW